MSKNKSIKSVVVIFLLVLAGWIASAVGLVWWGGEESAAPFPPGHRPARGVARRWTRSGQGWSSPGNSPILIKVTFKKKSKF